MIELRYDRPIDQRTETVTARLSTVTVTARVRTPRASHEG
jgi:hypothetical protein